MNRTASGVGMKYINPVNAMIGAGAIALLGLIFIDNIGSDVSVLTMIQHGTITLPRIPSCPARDPTDPYAAILLDYGVCRMSEANLPYRWLLGVCLSTIAAALVWSNQKTKR